MKEHPDWPIEKRWYENIMFWEINSRRNDDNFYGTKINTHRTLHRTISIVWCLLNKVNMGLQHKQQQKNNMNLLIFYLAPAHATSD